MFGAQDDAQDVLVSRKAGSRERQGRSPFFIEAQKHESPDLAIEAFMFGAQERT